MILQDIVDRKTVGGTVVRELGCGHKQEEPLGGKARDATRAYCTQCVSKKDAKRVQP